MPAPSPLEKIRDQLALPVGENAVFDGWTAAAVDSAARQLGIDPAQARLAFPKQAPEMIDAYVQGVDREMQRRLSPKTLDKMKIREKIRSLVWARLEIMAPAREAVRKALAILAMPAERLAWRPDRLAFR